METTQKLGYYHIRKGLQSSKSCDLELRAKKYHTHTRYVSPAPLRPPTVSKGHSPTSQAMSVSRPARCIFLAPPIPSLRPRIQCQNFSSTASQLDLRRPKYPSEIAKVSRLRKEENDVRKKKGLPAARMFKPYTDKQKALLAKRYTPQQMEAIEAGEMAISTKDLKRRGVIRTDPGAVPYVEDFSRTKQLVDRPQKYTGPIDPNIRLMTPDEQARTEFATWQEYGDEKRALDALLGKTENTGFDENGLPEQYVPEERLDQMKTEDRMPLFVGTGGRPIPREQTQFAFAPGLPRRFNSEDEEAQEKNDEDGIDPRDPDGVYNKLIKSTGLTLDEILKINVKILVQHGVRNQTRLGKIDSMYYLAIAGNGNGRLGIGEAKGQEAEESLINAKIAAIRAMKPIPRYENRTIYGEVEAKVSAVELKLMSRPPGKPFSC